LRPAQAISLFLAVGGMDYIPTIIGVLIIGVLIAITVAAYIVIQQTRIADEQRRAMEKLVRTVEKQSLKLEKQGLKLAQLAENSPFVITDEMYEKLRGATFAILDDGGHPVCCGFFVTPCGVALTAAHSCEYARPIGGPNSKFHAATYEGLEFDLDVVAPTVGTLDVAVLRLSAAFELYSGFDYLSLPCVHNSHRQLLGASVALIHGSIAWSAGSGANEIARDNGFIITSSETMLQYSVASYKGHSGAALLFRGGQVIGLHSEGFNDLEQELSEASPSTSANAVRLDVPQIWEAVNAAKVVPAAVGTGIRHRTRSSGGSLK